MSPSIRGDNISRTFKKSSEGCITNRWLFVVRLQVYDLPLCKFFLTKQACMSLALSWPWCRRDVGSIKLSKVYCKTNPLILRRLVSWSSWNTDFVLMLKPEEFCSCGVTESARVGHFYAPQQSVTSLCNSSLTLTGWAAVLQLCNWTTYSVSGRKFVELTYCSCGPWCTCGNGTGNACIQRLWGVT